MPYRAPLHVRVGHLNTIRAHFHRGSRPPYERERYETPDGDFFDVDRVPGQPGAPHLVGLHGLEGSSESAYMQRLMTVAQGLGWELSVVHARGCSGEDNRLASSYHAGFIDDVDLFLRAEHGRAQGAPLLAVGYSLGGSQLANWLGRTADAHTIVTAAVLVSPPLRLAPGADAICSGKNRHVYGRRFLRSLRRKALDKAAKWPAHRGRALAAARARSIRQYDHLWTGPMHGFVGAEDYYAKASAAPHLRHIRVPTRVLHASDDPFIPVAAVPAADFEGASHVELVRTPAGGHVGFFGHTHRAAPTPPARTYGATNWLESWILGSLHDLAGDALSSSQNPLGG